MIRYDKRLNSEINRVVRNFNQKVDRLNKSDKANVHIPNKVSVKQLKSTNNNRQELYKALNSLKRFSKRGYETTDKSGVSKWQKQNYAINLRTAKAKLTREIKKYNQNVGTVFGKIQKGMEDERLQTLRGRRKALENYNTSNLTLENFQDYSERVKKIGRQRKNEQFKENYLDVLDLMGDLYDLDEDKVNMLKDSLSDLSNDEFEDMFYNEQGIKTLLEYYGIIRDVKGFDVDELNVDEILDGLIENIDVIKNEYKR